MQERILASSDFFVSVHVGDSRHVQLYKVVPHVLNSPRNLAKIIRTVDSRDGTMITTMIVAIHDEFFTQ